MDATSRFLKGPPFKMHFETVFTIRQCKEVIFQEKNIPVDKIKIIVKSQIPADDTPIATLTLSERDIFIILNLADTQPAPSDDESQPLRKVTSVPYRSMTSIRGPQR
jgi:hypothetical protein